MRELLIRSGKDPFTPVSAEATLAQDVMNSNVGNYLFAHSVHKSLMTRGTELVSNSTLSETKPARSGDWERINERFDAFIVPLANAFRPEFARRLANLTTLIRGLEIPVIVVGVGAQADMSQGTQELAAMSPGVKSFVSAVLDRSASIGVRGEFTAKYLRELGFNDDAVRIIGCPSLFLHGRDFEIPQPEQGITHESRLALNVTPGVEGLGEITMRHAEKYPNLTYIGQDRDDLNLILWGQGTGAGRPGLPLGANHPLHRQDRVRFFLDGWTWLDFLSSYEFAFGTRLHGNIAALLAGTPAVLLAHDSRTLELAEYHSIPYRSMRDLPTTIDAEELHRQYDAGQFNERYAACFATYVAFLEENRLDHVHAPGQSNPEFASRLAATTFPPPVRTLWTPDRDELISRLLWLRDGQLFDGEQHKQAYRPPFPFPRRKDPATPHEQSHQSSDRRHRKVTHQLEVANRRLKRAQDQLVSQKERLKRQNQRLHRIERLLEEQQQRSWWRRLLSPSSSARPAQGASVGRVVRPRGRRP